MALCRTQFFTATFCEPNCLGTHAPEQQRGATAAALAILGRFKTKKAANGGSRPCMACRESKLEAESRIDAIADYVETVDYALGMSEQ